MMGNEGRTLRNTSADECRNEIFSVRVEALSPLHLGSGKADVTIDAEIVHDAIGLPYFPAKRFKGLLYESAMEVVEIMNVRPLFTADDVRKLFRHGAEDENGTQLVVSNLRLEEYDTMREDWGYLQSRYPNLIQPQDVLEQYTSLRYQTKIDPKTRMAANTSLHNMRVADKGLVFVGKLKVQHASEKALRILALALRNLEHAGLKRNRGFGKIRCTLERNGEAVGSEIIEKALKEWKEAGGR